MNIYRERTNSDTVNQKSGESAETLCFYFSPFTVLISIIFSSISYANLW